MNHICRDCPPRALRHAIQQSRVTYQDLLLMTPFLTHESFLHALSEEYFFSYLYWEAPLYDAKSIDLRNAVQDFTKPAVVIGDRGCGKSVFIRKVVRDAGIRCVFVDFESRRVGRSAYVINVLRDSVEKLIHEIGVERLADWWWQGLNPQAYDFEDRLARIDPEESSVFREVGRLLSRAEPPGSMERVAPALPDIKERLRASQDIDALVLCLLFASAAASKSMLVFDNLDFLPDADLFSQIKDAVCAVVADLEDRLTEAGASDELIASVTGVRMVLVYRKNGWLLLHAARDRSTQREAGRGVITDEHVIDISEMNDRREVLRTRNVWLLDHELPTFPGWRDTLARADAIMNDNKIWGDLEWMFNEHVRNLAIGLAHAASRGDWVYAGDDKAMARLSRQALRRVALEGICSTGQLSEHALAWPDHGTDSPDDDDQVNTMREVLLYLYNSLSQRDISLLCHAGVPDGLTLSELYQGFGGRQISRSFGPLVLLLFSGKDNAMLWSRFVRVFGGRGTARGIGDEWEKIMSPSGRANVERKTIRIAITRSGCSYIERLGKSFEFFGMRVRKKDAHGERGYEPLIVYVRNPGAWEQGLEYAEKTVDLLGHLYSARADGTASMRTVIHPIDWKKCDTIEAVQRDEARRQPWWDNLVDDWLYYLDSFRVAMVAAMDEAATDGMPTVGSMVVEEFVQRWAGVMWLLRRHASERSQDRWRENLRCVAQDPRMPGFSGAEEDEPWKR